MAAATSATATRKSAPRAAMVRTVALDRPAPADDPDEHHHHRDHQQCVDEPAHGVGRDQAERPEHEEDYGDRIEHQASAAFSLPPRPRASPSAWRCAAACE